MKTLSNFIIESKALKYSFNIKTSEKSKEILSSLGFIDTDNNGILEKNGKGLNLTYEVLDGILCHTKGGQSHGLQLQFL